MKSMIFWTLLISSFAIIGDIALKHAAVTKNNVTLIAGILLYIFDALLWYWVYKSAKFSTVAIVYSFFTIALSVKIGVFFFKEHLGIQEVLGLLFGLVSIALLSNFAA